MKKTLTAIILILALALCLAACSAGEVASAGDEEFVPEMPDVPVTKGKAEVDVGSFRVTVPEGWLGVGDLDYEDDGSTSVSRNYYVLVKGGETAQDQYEKPSLSIYFSSEYSAGELYDMNIGMKENSTEFTLTSGGKECPAYHYVIEAEDDNGDPFVLEYDNVFIPVTDSSCMRASMLTFETKGGDTGISVSNEDVLAILESLKAN